MADLITKRCANVVTLINIVFGSMAILYTINQSYRYAAIFILLAVMMDGMDGRIARRFDATSELGRELDSLCDLVSFGVAPAVLIYAQVLSYRSGYESLVLTVFYIACGCFRLARFNVLRDEHFFMGVPITIAGALMAMLSLSYGHLSQTLIMIGMVLLSFLMISKLRIKKI